jgi:uncharacterized protein
MGAIGGFGPSIVPAMPGRHGLCGNPARGGTVNVEGAIQMAGTAAERQVQSAYGSRERAQQFYDRQMTDRLNPQMKAFIAQQEMMFVASADAAGRCDNTLRAGAPGFVVVLDDRSLAWPEYRGNGVHATLANIAEMGTVGLLFVDFNEAVIGLHVNGTARIINDTVFRRVYPDHNDARAERWVHVEVEEAYIHCRKHIPRLVKATAADLRDSTPPKAADFFGVIAERCLDSDDQPPADQFRYTSGVPGPRTP